MTENEQKPHENAQTPPKKSSLKIAGFIFLAVFIGVAAFGIVSRVSAENKLTKKTDSAAVQAVTTLSAKQEAETEEIILPGTVQAWHEAVVYARTSGYLKSWAYDIGAHVKEGDILAVIDAPDLDAQFHQAQADLQTAEANNNLAQLTAKRDLALRKTDSIAQQAADTAVATAEADLATVNSSRANLDHLQQEENFKNVIAPFDGVITQRNTDVGALINGGSSTGQDLFHIAQTDKLRVYVQVPENSAIGITPNMVAELHYPQLPKSTFTATLTRAADAIDPTTRTLLVELEVDNADGTLLAGGYTDVHIKLPMAKNTIILPVNTLLFRDGLRVGVVKDNHIALTPITVGRDYGKTVEVVAGIAVGDEVVLNPPDSLQDGEQVHVIKPEDKKTDDKESKDKK